MTQQPSGAVDNNTRVELECEANGGNQSLNITWMREGLAINASPVYLVNHVPSGLTMTSTLSFNATPADNGINYVCALVGQSNMNASHLLNVYCK